MHTDVSVENDGKALGSYLCQLKLHFTQHPGGQIQLSCIYKHTMYVGERYK